MTKLMQVKINPDKNFDTVFGADCFRKYWPELETTGVLVGKLGAYWYIWDVKEQWCVNDTAFFTWKDIRDHMTIVRSRDPNGRFAKRKG